LQAQHRIAQELSLPLDVVRSMSVEEFHSWLEYLSFQAEAEKKAYEKAKQGKGRRR
jgi:hypothetical protein